MLSPSVSGSLYDETLKAVEINIMRANELHASDSPLSAKLLRESLLVLVRLAEQLAISIDSRQIAQIMNNILAIMKKVYLSMMPLTPVVETAQTRMTVQKNIAEVDRRLQLKSTLMGGVTVESKRGIDIQSAVKRSIGTLTDDLQENGADRSDDVQREIDIFFHTRSVISAGDIQPSNNFLNSLLEFQQGLAKDLDFLMESITDKPKRIQDDLQDQWSCIISQIEQKRLYTKETLSNFIERLRRLFEQKMQLTQSVGCQTPKRFQMQAAIEDTREYALTIGRLEKQVSVLSDSNKCQQKTIAQLTAELSSEKENNVKNGLAWQESDKLLNKLSKLLQQKQKQLCTLRARYEEANKAVCRQLTSRHTETSRPLLTSNQLSKMAIKIEPVRNYVRATVAATNSALFKGLLSDNKKVQPRHNIALLHNDTCKQNIEQIDEEPIKDECQQAYDTMQTEDRLPSQKTQQSAIGCEGEQIIQEQFKVVDMGNDSRPESLKSPNISITCSMNNSMNITPHLSKSNTRYSVRKDDPEGRLKSSAPVTNQKLKEFKAGEHQKTQKQQNQMHRQPQASHPVPNSLPNSQQNQTDSSAAQTVKPSEARLPPVYTDTGINIDLSSKCCNLTHNKVLCIAVQPQYSFKQSKDTSIIVNPPSERHILKHPKRKSMAEASLPSIHRNNTRKRLKPHVPNLPVLSKDLTIEATGCSPFRISPIRHTYDEIENLQTVDSGQHSPEKRQAKPFYSGHWSTEQCNMKEDTLVQEKLQLLTKVNLNLQVHITAELFYELKEFANRNSKDANDIKKFAKYVREAHRVKCGEVCHHIRKFILKLETYALLQEKIVQTLPRKFRV